MEKRRFIFGVLTLFGLIIGSTSVIAYTIDGNLNDWGLDMSQDWSLESTWLPNPGVYFQVEDNHNPNHASDPSIHLATSPIGVHIEGVGGSYSFYDEPPVYHVDGYKISEPYGSPEDYYDIEAIYFDHDSSYLYVAIIMGPEVDKGGDMAPGDLALDLDRDGTYEYGVKLGTGTGTGVVQFGIYEDMTWDVSNYIPANAPTVILSGTKIGDATGAYTGSYIPSDKGCANYVVELAIPKSAVGNPPNPIIYDLFLSEGCGNEHIPVPEFPILITAALLLVSPAFAYLLVKRKGG